MTNSLHFDMKGEGPSLVLLHPVGLDNGFWGPLVDRASENHSVIAIDLMGHGQSGPAAIGRGIGSYVADVKDLFDELDIASATVLGLSFGGMISQEFAIRHPGRTSRLIVGACGGRIPEGAREAVRARGTKALEAGGMANVVDETLDRWFTPSFLPSVAVERVRLRLLANDPQGWAAGWDAIAGFNALDRLGAIDCPCLVLAATEDAGTPVAATKAMADAIPRAEFAVLQHAPHMMQIECAERFVDQVAGFLDRTAS